MQNFAMKKLLFTLSLLGFLSFAGFGQVTSVPEEAKRNFEKQYPEAEAAVWSNNVISAGVRFALKGESMYAEYSNKGIWKFTYRDWDMDRLPDAVKDGFEKSKYADWQIHGVKIAHFPGNITRYRVEVQKSALQKRYLFFNEKGRMLKSALTL